MSGLMALDLECRLTIAHQLTCECAPCFARRREALLPAVLAQAEETGEDAVDLFASFARKVHERHGGDDERRRLGRIAALMAMVYEQTEPEG